MKLFTLLLLLFVWSTPGTAAFKRSMFKSLPVVRKKVVVIGSGPGGSTASLYTSRAMLNPLQIAGYEYGGQLMLTSDIENYPGVTGKQAGSTLVETMMVQAETFGTDIWRINVDSVDFSKYPFELKLHNCSVKADSVIVATGASALWLDAENESQFRGKGISSCATCDGFLFRGKDVVVVGGGDSAMEEALFLTKFASSVTIVHRSEQFRASKIMLDRALSNKKIKFVKNAKIQKWLGTDGSLTGLTYIDATTGTTKELKCDGAFIAIGHRPNTAFLKGQLRLDKKGYIRVNAQSKDPADSCSETFCPLSTPRDHRFTTMTNIPGVFACGDVADSNYRQAITAAGMGCQAAMDAERWLNSKAK